MKRIAIIVSVASVLIVANIWQSRSTAENQQAQKEAGGQKAASHQTTAGKKTTEELFKELEALAGEDPGVDSQEAYNQYLLGLAPKVISLADQILNQAKDEESVIRAIAIKFEMLDIQAELGEVLARLKAKQFAQKLASDKRPVVARVGKSRLIQVKAERAVLLKPAERSQLVDEMVSFLKADKLDPTAIRLAINVTQGLEMAGANADAAKAYEQVAGVIAKTKNPELEPVVKQFQGAARRLKLPGNELRLVGKTLSGEDFDWKSYKGKVVLVDFWATWCPNCVAEFPKLTQLYRQYNDQGFEIVGVNVDDNPLRVHSFLKLTPLPWVQLYGDENGRPGEASVNADYYGVTALPTKFLVGKDGKVVSIDAAGFDLEAEVKKLLAK